MFFPQSRRPTPSGMTQGKFPEDPTSLGSISLLYYIVRFTGGETENTVRIVVTTRPLQTMYNQDAVGQLESPTCRVDAD